MTEPTVIKFTYRTDRPGGAGYYCITPGDQSGKYVTLADYQSLERRAAELQHDLDNANYALAELRDGGSIAEMAAKLKRENEALREALDQITRLGGNLSDDRLTEKTGPNDAVQRGIMYTSARQVARDALGEG